MWPSVIKRSDSYTAESSSKNFKSLPTGELQGPFLYVKKKPRKIPNQNLLKNTRPGTPREAQKQSVTAPLCITLFINKAVVCMLQAGCTALINSLITSREKPDFSCAGLLSFHHLGVSEPGSGKALVLHKQL